MSYQNVRVEVFVLVLSATAAVASVARAEQQTKNPWNAEASPALGLLAESADAGQFAYVLFWRENDEATQRMNAVLQQATARMESPVRTIGVCVTDPRESESVKLFGVDRAPLPLIAAVAPNGAVTKAWPLAATADQLQEGLVSGGTAACLKAIQRQKLSLVCVCNSETEHTNAVRQAAVGFLADERFGAATEVIEIDPTDEQEREFLARLNVKPVTRDAVTVLLSPSGQPIGSFTGAVTTTQLLQKIQAVQESCCPGGKCGPGGCCPGGQCGPEGCCPGGQCAPQKQ